MSDRLAVVVPVYFNAGTLGELHRRIDEAVSSIPGAPALEFLFVDDGSGDSSRDVLRSLAASDERVGTVFLSRNFGSFTAIRAGLDHVDADCVAIISADLQDPPELLAEMFLRWREGEETVMAVRASRSDPWASRLMSRASYSLLRKLALPELPPGGFDFVLVDRRVHHALRQVGETNTSLLGLILWVGFRQCSVPYHRGERGDGSSRWTFWKKFKYLVDSLLAFSYVPIRAMSTAGVLVALVGFSYALLLVVLKLTRGFDVPGWTGLMVVVLILSGFQFLALGIIGEYLWRTLDESRRRPLYLVSRATRPVQPAPGGAP